MKNSPNKIPVWPVYVADVLMFAAVFAVALPNMYTGEPLSATSVFFCSLMVLGGLLLCLAPYYAGLKGAEREEKAAADAKIRDDLTIIFDELAALRMMIADIEERIETYPERIASLESAASKPAEWASRAEVAKLATDIRDAVKEKLAQVSESLDSIAGQTEACRVSQKESDKIVAELCSDITILKDLLPASSESLSDEVYGLKQRIESLEDGLASYSSNIDEHDEPADSEDDDIFDGEEFSPSQNRPEGMLGRALASAENSKISVEKFFPKPKDAALPDGGELASGPREDESEAADLTNVAGAGADVRQTEGGASEKTESGDSPTVESVKSEFERIASEIVSADMAGGDDIGASEISANVGHGDGTAPIAEKPVEAESAHQAAAVEQPNAAVDPQSALVKQPSAAVEQPNALVEQHSQLVEQLSAGVEQPSAAVNQSGAEVENSNSEVASNSLAEDGQTGSSGAVSSDSAPASKENEKGADFFESSDSPLGLGESDNKKPDFPTLFALPESSGKARKTSKADTCVIVNSLIGIGNKPYLRGAGGGLSADKGVPMEYLEIGKWRYVFPPDSQFPIEFSVYKNDETRSDGGEVFKILPNEKLELNLRFTI
ncbi:MAG TPA: hypothetical protein IAD27_06830 [Candidatus Merdousia gallistercoris]|nr:hypothetical protein [Candidatus Merdousia gallistercoris]